MAASIRADADIWRHGQQTGVVPSLVADGPAAVAVGYGATKPASEPKADRSCRGPSHGGHIQDYNARPSPLVIRCVGPEQMGPRPSLLLGFRSVRNKRPTRRPCPILPSEMHKAPEVE